MTHISGFERSQILLIPKRGIGQHAVDTALALGDDNGFDRSVRRLSMPFLFHCQFIAHCSHLSSNRRDRDFSTPSLDFAQDHRQGRFPPNTVLQPSPPGPAIRASFWLLLLGMERAT